MLNGLDLFSGIGGLSLALKPWVRPVAYCEIDRYAQGVLLSKMQNGDLECAPICDDVRALGMDMLPSIDIIYGGFPCQDISTAGNGEGLDRGSRSGLFHEIARLTEKGRPAFVFLENVPAIRTRGLSRVVREFSRLRYDCRWTTLSAADVGAPHVRKRWWLLAANSDFIGLRDKQGRWQRPGWKSETLSADNGPQESLANSPGERFTKEGKLRHNESEKRVSGSSKALAHNDIGGGIEGRQSIITSAQHPFFDGRGQSIADDLWWSFEPDVGRVADGVPKRVDRLKCLGNAVVPLQARVAFQKLMGL